VESPLEPLVDRSDRAGKIAGSGGLITHTDQGSQYRGSDYLKLLRKHGISCSVSTKGSCWDDAVVESFFSTLKFELNLNYDIKILFNYAQVKRSFSF
jgi:putative transposase